MNVRNYTSSVPADRSIAEVERLLMQIGATHITKECDKERIVGISFFLLVDGIPLVFEIPCEVEPIKAWMRTQYRRITPQIEKNIERQAERTAWRMTHDWVHIQASQVLVKRQEPLQVFLAYLQDPKDGTTFYQWLKNSGFKMLSAVASETVPDSTSRT